MRIALTGTPGVGKTTLAALLAEDGYAVVDVRELAASQGAVAGHDELDGSDVIDVDRLAAVLARDPPPSAPTVYDSHLSHFLPVDAIWVVRCRPDVVRARLQARGYAAAKIAENVEAEAMDLILQEAMATGRPVVQRDGTRRTPLELLSSFVENQPTKAKKADLEAVDWSDFLG